VTADEIGDPQQLAMWCEVDGHRMQDSHTSRMIFSVAHCLAHLSCFMTLEPGDLVATGTPAGVGLGKKPPRFLRDGGTMRLGIAGLGLQTQAVKRASRPA
jgi:ureidoglycolate lyase/2,4-diketo-3-deoxy-L-fuconate hydrolase